ncbi:hypothetical protein CSUI_007471, partial [Cystoisospora suis]
HGYRWAAVCCLPRLHTQSGSPGDQTGHSDAGVLRQALRHQGGLGTLGLLDAFCFAKSESTRCPGGSAGARSTPLPLEAGGMLGREIARLELSNRSSRTSSRTPLALRQP